MNTLKVTRDQGVITDKKPRACARTKHRYFVPSYMLDATDNTALSNFEKLNVWFFLSLLLVGEGDRLERLTCTGLACSI